MQRGRWEAPTPESILAVMTMTGVKKRHYQRLFNELNEMVEAALVLLNAPDE